MSQNTLPSLFLLIHFMASHNKVLRLGCAEGASRLLIGCSLQARRDEVSGREFFIDHNSRKTTWVRPALPVPVPVPSAATPDSSTPSGVSPEGSSGDLAAAAEAASEAAADAEQGTPAAASKAGDLRFGLFGLGVDEVRTAGSLACLPCT